MAVRRTRDQEIREKEHAAFEVSLALVAAVTDPHVLGPMLAGMTEGEVRLAAATLAAMVDDEHLTVGELRRRARNNESWPCHPALWGESWRSESVHGTRARYVAGCRGGACVEADVTYHAERHQRRRAADHLQAVGA